MTDLHLRSSPTVLTVSIYMSKFQSLDATVQLCATGSRIDQHGNKKYCGPPEEEAACN